jgi:transcriptional regulator with XRE-family HTH domain
MPTDVLGAGRRLRLIRESLGLTIRDVEAASTRLAAKYGNEDFAITLSRLSDIEAKGVVPGIFRLYSLAVIYRLDIRELLAWFGIDVNNIAADLRIVEPPKSHRAEALQVVSAIRMPVRIDPGFDLRKTTNLGRMIERWGIVPVTYLAQFENVEYSYGYIGSEDFTMYPILLPGSLVQIDESKNEVTDRMWHSEYERPIYFVETRTGFVCSWCALKGEDIVLQPHPLSPVAARILRYPRDAEIVGQVIGVAMRLGDFFPNGSEPRAPRKLN